MAHTKATRHAGSGTLLLILIQVASRGFTFIGNQFLLRFLSPSLLGIAIQLELVSVTSLYFARESLRVALQRQPPSISAEKGSLTKEEQENARANETQTAVNLSYLAVLLGFVVSTILGYSYLRSASEAVLGSPYFGLSYGIYAVATLIEVLAEPAFVVIQQKALYKDRARAETSAAMARCVSACAVAVLGRRSGLDPSILPFAVGQAAYAVVLLGFYLLPTLQLSRVERFDLVPRLLSSQAYYLSLFHKEILSLASTMYLQSVFKLLLTQGDALIMSFFSSLADQGAFALASNYGGLLARLIFQPVEESSRNVFGRLLAPGATTDSTTVSFSTQFDRVVEECDATAPSSSSAVNTRTATKYLSITLRVYLFFSWPLIQFGRPLLPHLVPFVLSSEWRTHSTIALLQMHCSYIPLMAVNGILDAFVTSVATPAQLSTQSLWMMAFTGIYGVATWQLMEVQGMGSVGLVGANMVNMALRIAWSLHFIRSWAKQKEYETGQKGLWRAMMLFLFPDAAGVVSAWLLNPLVSTIVANLFDQNTGKLSLLAVGVWLGVIGMLVSVMLYTDGIFLLTLLDSVLPERLAARMPSFLRKLLPAQPKTKTT
ncbi:Oligosaccharide translocation protein rft1 [Cladophialophora chaetospira]|uniref:Man(5)GlcNAc(2)-PP-dolichol translocation protein RFT1 n=1 Tax=Cladophialophora chaetospira TaxID=386627 RepID=A0AA39CHE9_9EURO|nr:Oligosaccharide translocation protein rft1 [Cladophialophora chaetospira]